MSQVIVAKRRILYHLIQRLKMSRRDQNWDVPESTIPQSSKKELPWFVCAAITTGLIAFCYEYSESLEDTSTSTSKGAQRVSHPSKSRDLTPFKYYRGQRTLTRRRGRPWNPTARIVTWGSKIILRGSSSNGDTR